MKYDVLFIDLDGTLLDDNKNIPENNIDSLRKLVKMGVEVVIATGRSYMSLRNMHILLGIDRVEGYGIAFNGGSIIDRVSGKVVYNNLLDKNMAKSIIRFVDQYKDIECCVYADECLWVTTLSEKVISYCHHSMLLPYRCRGFKKVIETKGTNKIILMGENDYLKKIQQDFAKTNMAKEVECCFSSKTLLEFNPITESKGTAVDWLMKKFDSKKSMAIGDSYNDIPMFKACDFSVAICNSDEEVKNNASAVTTLSNNDGILNEIIEKYIL